MKPSHFTTPRTMAECHFAHNADHIERPTNTRMDMEDRMVCWACFVCILAVLAIIYWP